MEKIIRMKELVERLSLSRSSIYRLIGTNSFIPKVILSDRCVGFLESDLNKWLEKRINKIEEI